MPVAIVLVIGGGMYLMGHTDIREPANLGGLFPSIRIEGLAPLERTDRLSECLFVGVDGK